MAATWIGAAPKRCDMCGGTLSQVFVDLRTRDGRWGIMCPPCRIQHGPRTLGPGRGQKYRLNLATKAWDKVDG